MESARLQPIWRRPLVLSWHAHRAGLVAVAQSEAAQSFADSGIDPVRHWSALPAAHVCLVDHRHALVDDDAVARHGGRGSALLAGLSQRAELSQDDHGIDPRGGRADLVRIFSVIAQETTAESGKLRLPFDTLADRDSAQVRRRHAAT